MTEPLSDSELEAMRILWEESPLKPGQIQERFAWEIDNGTLRSTLAVLMTKGKVTRTKEGKAFLYAPAVERPSVLKSLAERLSRILTGGSTSDFVMELVRSEQFTPEQIQELQRIAAGESDATKGSEKRGNGK
ncbi:transcriptional regulator [bacterium]|nr:transcriptional regulator [bacterium]